MGYLKRLIPWFFTFFLGLIRAIRFSPALFFGHYAALLWLRSSAQRSPYCHKKTKDGSYRFYRGQ
jgi:hypothetical protein